MELTLKVFMTTGTHFSLPVIICRNSITIPFIKTPWNIPTGSTSVPAISSVPFRANVAQNLLNSGVLDTGLIAAEGYDYEIIEKSYRPHDNLSILATLKADNTVEKTIVGSIMESLILDSKNEAEYARLREIFKNPSLQMASFTITEKGYATANAKGEFFPAVAADFEKGPEAPESYLGKVVSLLYTRYTHGALPHCHGQHGQLLP